MKKTLPLTALILLLAYHIQAQCFTLTNCPATTVDICDFSTNDNKFWNATYWYDNAVGSHDLAEGVADLSVTAKDNCFQGGLTFRYQLFLDMDNNGVMETVVDSKTPTPVGGVYYGNALNPNYSGGSFRLFDQRNVPPLQKYRFGMQISGSGSTKTARVRWKASTSSASVAPQLPYGTHKIKWIVENAQGNTNICEYIFTVKDCQKPTLTCVGGGYNVNLMQTGMITLWASDFLQYGEDNVTPVGLLKYGIRKSGSGSGFPLDANGNPIPMVTYTCDEIGAQSAELWAMDLAGNTNSCTVEVNVQNNLDNCDGTSGLFSVCLQKFCSGEPIDGALFSISGSSPAVPVFTFFTISNNQGCGGSFNAIPLLGNAQISAGKDDNPLDGITLYDINLLIAHIDGTQPFTEPRQYIAADVNRDNIIDSLDLIELQGIQSGIYDQFPNNGSWRFIRGDYMLPPNPLLAPIPESVTISEILATSDSSFVFKGIKIGDISCSAGFDEEIPTDRQTTENIPKTKVFPPQPNPTSGASTISLQLAEAGKVQLTLFDLSGKMVYSIENQMDAGPGVLNLPINASFSAGIYVWKVQIDGVVFTGKIVVE